MFLSEFVKNNIILILCLVCLISFIYYHLFKSTNYYNNTIIIQDNVKTKSLSRNIIKAYLVMSRMENNLTALLPMTRYFSHWMIMLKTDDEKYFLISADKRHYIEIINPNFDGYKKHNIYYYHNRQYYYTIIKEYDIENIKINVMEYANNILKEYKRCGNYNLLSVNCQYLAVYGLVNILHIKCGDEITLNYNIPDIFANIVKNINNFIDLDYI